MQQHIFGPAPWGHGEGPQCQISLNVYYKVNFKIFFNQTLEEKASYFAKLSYRCIVTINVVVLSQGAMGWSAVCDCLFPGHTYFLYVFSQIKDYKTYQTRFSFVHLGSNLYVCPSSYLLNHWTKSN